MKRKVIVRAICLLWVGSGLVVQGQTTKNSLRFAAGGNLGYNRGFGIQATLKAYNFSPGFPFQLRLGMGYTALDPGNPADARRIFINNATNGEPEKRGTSWDFRLDFLKSRPVFGIQNSYIVFGPRFSTFMGEFRYVGGNEDFEVRSKQWGIGGGLENNFKMAARLTLVFSYGLDFYFPSTLTGHDTSYSPFNNNINPENNNQNGDLPFTYRDANKAIRQPLFMPRALLGITYNL